MRAPIPKRHAEALRTTDSNVSTEFAGRLQERQCKQVCRNNEQTTGVMHPFGETPVVMNCTICRRILDNRAENRFIEIYFLMVTDAQLDTEGFSARLQHRNCLWMTRL